MVLMVKNPAASAGDVRNSGLIPEFGRSPGEGHGTHSSVLAWTINSMDKRACQAMVYGVAKSQARTEATAGMHNIHANHRRGWRLRETLKSDP